MWKSGAPSCRSCCHQISGKYFTTSNGDRFHHNCLRCKDCYKSLSYHTFYFRNGGYYCKNDYNKRFGIQCKICKDYVNGTYLQVAGCNYHTDCFRCYKCSSVLSSTYYNVSGSFLCNNCANKSDGIHEMVPGIEIGVLTGIVAGTSGGTGRENNNPSPISSSEINQKFEDKQKGKGKSKGETKSSRPGILGTILIKTCELLF